MIREGTPAQVRDGAAEWSITTGDGPAGLLELGRVDHVVTDPPYEAEAHTKGRRLKRQAGAVLEERPLDFAPTSAAQREEWGRIIATVCRRWALVFCQSEGAVPWMRALTPAMRHVRIGAWIKPDGQPQLTGDRPGVGWEAIEICHGRSKGRMKWNGHGMTAVWRAVWTHNKQDPEFRAGNIHQTQKPLALMLDLVRLFTDPGDLVADCFAGSGTTVIACLALGRRCVAWEERESYADIARERVRAWCAGNTVSAARAGQVPLFPA